MSSSYFSESEAPRDFRVSSTESDGHYTKCLLCFTVKRNFYCSECIRTGNFVQSSMPYSDRYSEKQAKLLRLKANRKYILDRCEKLLHPKLKKDTLITEAKLSQDKLGLLRLAIGQRKSNIEEKRKELANLKNHNNDLKQKLPRYQKRVSTLSKHVQNQGIELQTKLSLYNEQAETLAALRRSRIRHLTKYIFPVYMTYDTSDSIEDLEFIGSETEEEPPKRPQLHIVSPWINTDAEFSHVQAWSKDSAMDPSPASTAWRRNSAGLALAAQLLTLLAWVLDTRLPHALSLNEYCNWRCMGGGGGGGVAAARARRVCACACVLALHTHAHAHAHPLEALHALTVAALTDDPALGRAERAVGAGAAAWCARWEAPPSDHEDAEPEHLHWPDTMELASDAAGTPPSMPCPPPPAHAPATSLVTSAAASLASMWRGWTN